MTAFEALASGDIVWATDPLSEKGRPLHVLDAPRFPAHGTQLITVLLSTKAYHEAAVTLRDDDYAGEPLDEQSHALPWALATLTGSADLDLHLTSLTTDRTDDIADHVTGYISA